MLLVTLNNSQLSHSGMGSFFREFIWQFLLSLGSDSSPQFEAIMELVKYNLFECNKVCVEIIVIMILLRELKF